ncbi:MAG: hypothetical protein AAF318_03935 [Pseudomonadota bacterium]
MALQGPLAILVPTTGGTAVIASLAPQPGARQHFATLKGDFRKLPISGDYAQFATLADPAAVGLRLELTDRVETGRSWEFPALVAHRALAAGLPLTDDVALAATVIFATGEIGADLSPGRPPEGLCAKLDHAAPLFSAAGGTIVALHGPLPTEDDAALATAMDACGGTRIAIGSAPDIAALFAAPPPPPPPPASTSARRAASSRFGKRAFLASGLVAAALAVGVMASNLSTTLREEEVSALMNIAVMTADTRAACQDALMAGQVTTSPVTVEDGAVALPEAARVCALTVAATAGGPTSLIVPPALGDALIPHATPIGRPVGILAGQPYTLIFAKTPTAGATLTAVRGEARQVVTLAFEGDE